MLYDIVFISYQEPNADENWAVLKERFPHARRLHGVVGIHKAHQLAARASMSSYIWVVDGDSVVTDDFDFAAPVDLMEEHEREYRRNVVYVYRAQNPINDLSYGYGGIKLLPRLATANMDTGSVDMTTSISEHFYPIEQVASITKFNTDSFNTWKSAFRECVKLSSKVIEGQVDSETAERLDTWCTYHNGSAYGDWAVIGANLGREYGTANKDNPTALKLINDFAWLQEHFNKTI